MARRDLHLRPTDDDRGVLAGLAAIRAELEVPDGFPAEVLADAEQAARAPRLPEADLTEVPFVTIDPAGARDLDQALHVGRRGSGLRVTYAIADVAAFVRPGGPVDGEAHRRGVTLYAPDRRTPLHPPVLSEGAASLLPDEVRPAVVWRMDLDSTGEGRDVVVSRAMVRSRAQLTYEQVQAALDDGSADEPLQLLREVGLLREQRELDRGGATLPIPDQEIRRTGDEFRVELRAPLPVEGWNAQVSLMTGMAAADLMLGEGVGIVRTLPPPDPSAVATLRRVARALGVAWEEDQTWGEVVRTLDPQQPAHAALLVRSTVMLRGAGYAAFDGFVPEQARHAALAAEYSHVTAPLRRLVDRYAAEVCLAICAGAAVPDWARSALPQLPAEMADADRRAGAYERAAVDLVEAALLAGRVGEVFEAAVVSVDGDGAGGVVQLPGPDVVGRVAGTDLPLGAEVRVRLVRADVGARTLDFELVR